MAKTSSKRTRKTAKGGLDTTRRGDREERDTLPAQVRGAATRKGKAGSKISLPDEAVVRETSQTVPVARTPKLGKAARTPMPSAAIDRRRFTGDEKAGPSRRGR